MGAKRILVGEFGRPHGVRGLLRLRSFTEAPEAIAAYGTLTDESGQRSFAVEVLPGGLARVRGVGDRDSAARLTGVKLYVLRDALPPTDEDEFYLSDLIGLSAVGEDGTVLGRVMSVEDFGAGPFLTLRDAKGRDREVPFTRACVPVVDLAAGRCTVVPPEEIVVQPENASEKGEGEAA
jgi:16S rRNA processing protein RimM